MKKYLRGFLILLAVLVLGLLGIIFLGILEIAINLVYGLIVLAFAILAIIILPSYIGKKKVVESKDYSLNEVKKS